MRYTTPHASVLNTATINIATTDTAQLVTFDTNVMLVKSAHSTSVNPSRVTINEAGNYIVFVTTQATASGAGHTLDCWFRINGTDVVNSNVKTTIVNSNDQKLVTITMPMALTAGQYVELAISADHNSVSLTSSIAGTSPTRPASPAVIMTIDRLI